MKLYHFTARHLLPGIRAEGLTRGMIPAALDPPTFRPNWQWLTANPEWQQSWCENLIAIRYRRDDARLALRIPKSAHGLLRRWNDARSLTPLADLLSAFGDPQNWWLFHGRVPPSWIRAIDWNPALKVAT